MDMEESKAGRKEEEEEKQVFISSVRTKTEETIAGW